MIQTTQKTVEILQVQFIDMVAEISEIMPSKDKCQRSRRCGNSRKFTDKNLDVPIVLNKQCQPSAQVPDRIRTIDVEDARMQNVSPQASQTPRAKTRLTRKSRERQPTKRRQECLKHERDKAPPDVWTGRSVHTCLSRGVPADHEGLSQVKEKRKSSCRSEGTQRKPHPKERLYSKIQERGKGRPRA